MHETPSGLADHSASENTYSLFQSDWWLNAVSPGGWSVATVVSDGVTVGRWPYFSRDRLGLHVVTQPTLTQTLGPWIRPVVGKGDAVLSSQHDLLIRLIDGLPTCDLFAQNLDPAITNPLPFVWKGFDVLVRCTYRLPDIADPEKAWFEFSDRCRNTIRKAKKTLTVREDGSVKELFDIATMSWARQGRNPPYTLDTLERIVGACETRSCHRILLAIDDGGRCHAGMLMVFDSRTAYYLVGGADPDLRGSGANSLLLWHAISVAAPLARCFDFEGSMHEGIERFFRSFGAQQTQFLHVRRMSRRMRALSAIRDFSVAATGRPTRWFY